MRPFTHHETNRLLYQIEHQKTLYNGASGFTPPIREQQWDWLWQQFPDASTIDHLQHEGVDIILVDFSLYHQLNSANFTYAGHSTPHPTDVRLQLSRHPHLTEIGCTSEACLYTIQTDEQ